MSMNAPPTHIIVMSMQYVLTLLVHSHVHVTADTVVTVRLVQVSYLPNDNTYQVLSKLDEKCRRSSISKELELITLYAYTEI